MFQLVLAAVLSVMSAAVVALPNVAPHTRSHTTTERDTATVGSLWAAATADQIDDQPSSKAGNGTKPNGTSPNGSTPVKPSDDAYCDVFYTVGGGSRSHFRGQYNKGPTSMSCGGKPIYIQDAASPYYLYSADGTWWVANQDSMRNCQATGFIMSTTTCACPDKCTPPSGCAGGAWLTNTGKQQPEAECKEETWCPSGVYVE